MFSEGSIEQQPIHSPKDVERQPIEKRPKPVEKKRGGWKSRVAFLGALALPGDAGRLENPSERDHNAPIVDSGNIPEDIDDVSPASSDQLVEFITPPDTKTEDKTPKPENGEIDMQEFEKKLKDIEQKAHYIKVELALIRHQQGYNQEGVHVSNMTSEEIEQFLDDGKDLQREFIDLQLSDPKYADVKVKYEDFLGDWYDQPGDWDFLEVDTKETLATVNGYMSRGVPGEGTDPNSAELFVRVAVRQDLQYELHGNVVINRQETNYSGVYKSKPEVFDAIKKMREQYGDNNNE